MHTPGRLHGARDKLASLNMHIVVEKWDDRASQIGGKRDGPIEGPGKQGATKPGLHGGKSGHMQST